MARPHPAVGIDLGTTNSTVAFVDATGRPETIRNAEGGLSTPSAVFFDRSAPVIGSEAMEAGVDEPERLALFAKRDVGEQAFRKSICGASFPPEVLQALVLRKLKQDAQLKLGTIDKAVITVPAFFNEPCRKSTQDAGRLAGLDVLDIINEPTAAAICFGVQQGFLSPDGESERGERVLVYDLGGGTFDVTVMEIKDRNYHTIATNGDVYLGGIDWDRRIVDFIAEAWMDEHGDDPREDPIAEQILLRKANQTKHALTQRESVPIAFAHHGQRIRPEINRDTFHRLTEDLLERTLMTVGLVLDEAGMTWGDLTRLILVGGSTRMPMIRDELSRLTSLELDRSLSPDEAVAHGAAIYAGIRLGQGCETFSGVSVTNVNSHDLGVLAKDPKTGEPRRQIMIKRNTALPARQRIRFRTHEDGQKNVKVQVVEGGDAKGRNATMIGKCVVNPLPADTPKGTFVDVQFDYSQDGRLTVSATLPTLHCNAKMTMDRAAGMSDEVMTTWQQRIETGISEETIQEVLSLGELADDASADDESSESDQVDGAASASLGSERPTSGADDSVADESVDEGAFPGIQIGGKPKAEATVAATDIPDFGSPTAKPSKSPVVEIAVGGETPAKKQGKEKLSKAKPSKEKTTSGKPSKKKLKRKPLNETPVVVPVETPDEVSADMLVEAKLVVPSKRPDDKVVADKVVAETAVTETAVESVPDLPQPKAAAKTKPSSAKLPAGLADLAGAAKPKDEVPDFTGIADAGPSDEAAVDFKPVGVESAPQPSAGGSELDAFFSQQTPQESASNAAITPAIDVNASPGPKKLRRGGASKTKARKSKGPSSDADENSDWKSRGKRLSSGDQESSE
ncbi:MAG: Hsp70 family protein [Rubripirellula sp.]